ncbi:MAG: tRNA pseudouridine(55) synthase TruB [Bacilli bacterium]|nr:tRNA pseudouridine(55) synthase TruB [Bacilli bacterium]
MNGILAIYKEKGYTSRDVVNIISKELGTKKVGHTGTLDPLATGVLVLCIGQGLKLVELLTNHDKEYIAKIKLGIETDTLDITGNVLKQENIKNYTKKEVEVILKNFVGKINQEVPKYSAIKVNGKKLYEYARNNIEVDLPTREVEIFDLKLISDVKNNEFYIKCHVSKGTYIRSLVRDIGKELGTCATMTELERTKLGDFELENTYTLDDINSGLYQLSRIEDVLKLPKITVDKDLEKKIRNGQVLKRFFAEDMAMIINKDNKLIAIYQSKNDTQVKPYRMFI